MNDQHLPRIPFGAVYFRKSNPPRADWARDYATAAEDGVNVFRHWFLWSAIEVAPGRYDWDDYDRQLDLAAEHGLKTIIAEMITAAPEWAFRQYAHARYETAAGVRIASQMSGSCVTGGFPGLCLDNEDVQGLAGRFLTELATRYRDHPGLGGYDVWNECNILPGTCYCEATAERFRAWLRDKYGDLRTLGQAWQRHSYADWLDVVPPRSLGPYPDTLDWLQFRIDNAYRLMRWRVDRIRGVDPNHPITAHGIAAGLDLLAAAATDDWRAAAEVDSYGLTWVASRKGDEPWKQWHALDLTRAACRGKRFWHAEAQGGPLWMQPQVIGRAREDGRISTADDVRLWHLTSFAGGATGLLYPRWRPLLDGPLFGAFGPYGMDGSRTPRSRMSSALAVWANAPEQEPLWQARPVQGEVGIVVVPESQIFAHAQQGNTEYYARSMRGAYRGFFDNGVQADWVHIDDIGRYSVLYLPYPVMLSERAARALTAWVERGGCLISEGCPAYFGHRGRVGVRQPNLGLDALFGAQEAYVEFAPDLLEDLALTVGEMHDVHGGLFLQAYEPTGGQAVGWYEDGRVAVVDHTHGQGKTRLIGTFPGAGYMRHADAATRRFYADLLVWAGATPHLRCHEDRLVARLHASDDDVYLWVTNPTRTALAGELQFSASWGPFRGCQVHWGGDTPKVSGRQVAVRVPARDALVVRLIP